MNPYAVVDDFEERVAAWAGAPYGITVESGTAAIFLALMFRRDAHGTLGHVEVPRFTYPSIPCSVIHAGGKVAWWEQDRTWEGTYCLSPWDITDSALRFRPNMYQGGLHCLSFHIKKHLPIGRGGMILTDSRAARDWLRCARFDGRAPVPLGEDHFTMLGWNMYLQPGDAARGIQLFEVLRDKDLPDLSVAAQGYADLSRFPVYTE